LTPYAISPKWEYARLCAEIFSQLAAANPETTTQRQTRNSKSPLTAGFSAQRRRHSPLAGMAGWGGSADRTGLRLNFLLTGNFGGNIAAFGFLATRARAKSRLWQGL